MPLKEQISVQSPEPVHESGAVEMHIVKKRGKFHGHVVMADGAEHHAPPHGSMHEAHAALAEHIGAPTEEKEPEGY